MSKQSKNLLREAIADAKQVRETALANARLALEEAFTPHLSSMLATKLRNEEEEEEDLDEAEDNTSGDGHGSDEGGETDKSAVEDSTFTEAADVKSDGAGYKSSDIGTDSPSNDYGTSDPKEPAASGRQTAGSTEKNPGMGQMGTSTEPLKEDDEADLDLDADDDDQMGAGVGDVAEDDVVPGADADAGMEDEEPQDMDLESIIRELEADIDDDDVSSEEPAMGDVTEDDMDAEVPAVDDDDREELAPEDEMPTEGTAGTQQTDAVADGHGSDEGGETDTQATADSTFVSERKRALRKEAESGEDDVDLDEILREIEDEEEDEKTDSALARAQSELKEYRTAVKFLRSKLNEVNLLNAKLLYTNRLFRDYNMDVRSKMRVVENFDRATTVREAKLVYATIAESFRGKGTVSRKVRSSITEGLASKKSGSTAPKGSGKTRVDENTPTILREGVDLADRFKKLAGIK